MSFQLNIDFNPVHHVENNADSQAFLNLHKDDFSKNCWNILLRLLDGQSLSCKQAINENLSGHLPRRIADLKQYGIAISDKWISAGTNAKAYKEYFIKEEERTRIYQLILNKAYSFKRNNTK